MNARVMAALLAGALGLGVFAGQTIGATSPILAKVHFGEIDLNSHTIPADRWQLRLKTRGVSDGYVVDNKIAAGTNTGWHTHPGPSLIFVVAGTVTNYSSDQPGCAGVNYSAGEGFVDPGGGDVHMLQNKSDQPAETIAVQLLPQGSARKTDEPEPDSCHI